MKTILEYINYKNVVKNQEDKHIEVTNCLLKGLIQLWEGEDFDLTLLYNLLGVKVNKEYSKIKFYNDLYGRKVGAQETVKGFLADLNHILYNDLEDKLDEQSLEKLWEEFETYNTNDDRHDLEYMFYNYVRGGYEELYNGKYGNFEKYEK